MHSNNWFCVITSAPRQQPTVESTVESLRGAGFDPRVYAEPGTEVLPRSAIGAIHPYRLGVWHNWVHSARRALKSQAEYCLITQDDLEVHPDTQSVLDRLFEDPKYRVISVYTPRAYSHERYKVHCRRVSPGLYPVQSNTLWGAVGFAWRWETLKLVLEHPLITNWRGVRPAVEDGDIVNSDVAIGKIMWDLRIPIWFPTPSFGIHTAKFSSIPGHGSNDVRRNRNSEQPADTGTPLWDQLFPSV